MNKLFLFFICFVIYTTNYSQVTFETGSITKFNGETINGYVKILSDVEIEFKTTLDAESSNYNNKSIKGFSLAEPERKFVSKTIKKTNASYFFEYIVKSEVSLLYVNNNYYIHSEENDIILLEIKKTNEVTKKGTFESSISTYKGVLSYYAKDCPEVQEEAQSVSFKRNKLADYIIKLNECRKADSENYSYTSRIDLLEISFTVGSNFANFQNTGAEPYKTRGSSPGLSVGSFISFSPDITRLNLTFQLGLEYNQKKVDYTYKTENLISERTITHDAAVIEPFAAIIYQPLYNKKSLLNPYIGVGSSYGFNLKNDVTKKDIITDEAYEVKPDQSFSVMLKAGTFIMIKKQKFVFEISYTDYNYQHTNYVEDYGTNLQLKLGYVFSIK
ncbi:outer membrane beta-barrel protein [Aquaticitalea lipolytica]|nr:outer membrane beta-barrel protein [Aquaticitalea lipolytica]